MSWFTTKPRIEHLVRDHYQGLYRFAYRLSGSRAEAEDLTQETFCQAQQKLSQLRDAQAARSWLFTILRNAFLRRIRSAGSIKLVSMEDVAEIPERSEVEVLSVDPARLQEALGELPETFRTPLVLYYFEDFSYREIAEQMNVPLGTVMSRLARAKEHLRSKLIGAEGELLAGAREVT